MALIKCPECGKEVSDRAEACIHCGFPLKSASDLPSSINENELREYIRKGNAYTLKYIRSVTNLGTADAFSLLDNYMRKNNLRFPNGTLPGKWEDLSQQLHCPKCYSTAVTTGARGVNGFWGMIGAGKTVNRCGKCGYTWTP